MADLTETSQAQRKTTLLSLFWLAAPFTFAHLTHHLLTALGSPLSPYIRDEFNLTNAQVGLLLSAFSVPYGIAPVIAGWMADRVGRRILITVAIAGVALAGFLIGISTSYVMLFTLFLTMGVMGGGYHPSAPPLILATVPKDKQGRTMGFHMLGGGYSHTLAPLIGVGIASLWGWRFSYIGLAVPTLIFGVIFYFYLGRKSSLGRYDAEMKKNVSEAAETKPGSVRRILLFVAVSSIVQSIVMTIVSFIPLLMVDRFGFPKERVGVIQSLIYSAGLWASPVGGYIADKIGKTKLVLLVSLAVGPVIYLVNSVPYGIITWVLLFIIGITIYFRAPATEAYIMNNSPARHRSTLLGAYFFAHTEGASLLLPVIGAMVDRFGFQTTFTAAAMTAIAVSVASIPLMWRKEE